MHTRRALATAKWTRRRGLRNRLRLCKKWKERERRRRHQGQGHRFMMIFFRSLGNSGSTILALEQQYG